MFTGIVEEVGTVASITRGAHSAVLAIQAGKVLKGTQVGDSIAVNGVCLTATSLGAGVFTADVMHETLNRSSLGELRAGSPVNLERAMAAGGRFGGHIVSGHIDGVGTITRVTPDDNAVWYAISAPANILRYVIEKGSITIDGISLTVARVDSEGFEVSLIPHTRANTNLAAKGVGHAVNLEADVIGKYVEKLLYAGAPTQVAGGSSAASGESPAAPSESPAKYGNSSPEMTWDFLAENGF